MARLKREKPVLFASQRSYERAENLRAVFDCYEGMKEFARLDRDRYHSSMDSNEYYLMVTDEIPVGSPGTVILLWHAIEGGKKIGLDMPRPYATRREYNLIDYAITSGTATVPIVCGNTGLPSNRVLPFGMPRTDLYSGKKKGDGKTVLAKKRTYLFVPTFRTDWEPQMPEINWKQIDDLLTDDELFVVKAHPTTGRIVDNIYRHILELSPDEPSANYLIDCDVVVTDYSSILFDGYLLKKPCVLFEKTPGYADVRGMYFQYPGAYSSKYCTNEFDLVRLCRVVKGMNTVEQYVIRKVADRCNGYAAKRVCKLIEKIKENETQL